MIKVAVEIILIVGQSNRGEMRKRRNENESIRHNQPVHFNEVQTDSILDTLKLTEILLSQI